MPRRTLAPVIATVLGAALAMGGCGGGKSKPSQGLNSSATSTAAATQAATASGPVKLTVGVRKIVATTAAQKGFRPHASVHPDDVVQIEAVAAGPPANDVQLTVQKGPSNSLVATARADGRATKTASIRSASGTAISLTLARYTCVIGVTRFCDHVRGTEGRGAFTLTSSKVPSNNPVLLQANVAGPSGG